MALTNQWNGYFDVGKDGLKTKIASMSDFNREFGAPTAKQSVILSKDPTQPPPTTYRGHVMFQFIGPNSDQTKKVALEYIKDGPPGDKRGKKVVDQPYVCSIAKWLFNIRSIH